MKTKILVVDNEQPIRASLVKLIKHFMDASVLIYEATGVQDGLSQIEAIEPDILFLDIEMEDGTGFDLLRRVEFPSFQLIFTTAHNQYAIQAFEFSALNYLMKPISPAALENSLTKAIQNVQKKNLHENIEVLLSQMGKSDRPPVDQKIALNDAHGTYFVKIKDIIYCQADGPYTKFVITNSPSLIISKNLKEYEMLLETHKFLRCHHSFLVNSKLIAKFERTDGGILVMEDGNQIPVSQRKKDQVMEFLARN